MLYTQFNYKIILLLVLCHLQMQYSKWKNKIIAFTKDNYEHCCYAKNNNCIISLHSRRSFFGHFLLHINLPTYKPIQLNWISLEFTVQVKENIKSCISCFQCNINAFAYQRKKKKNNIACDVDIVRSHDHVVCRYIYT